MKFIENVEKYRYEKFVKGHKKAHFLQSYAWGEFSKECKNLIPHYVGMEDSKGNLLATALLLEKKLPLGFSYFYSPRGFVIDFNDYDLLTDFVYEIKKYAKKNKAIFVKIDPDIILNRFDNNDEIKDHDLESDDIIDKLKELGFNHLGFTKNFETSQPRYTFRINLDQSEDDLFNSFSKTTKQRINRAEKLDTKVRIGTIEDIKIFSDLMDLTEKRKDFISYDYNYYKRLFEIYNEDNKINFFVGTLNIKKVIKEYETELNEVLKAIAPLEDNYSKSKKLNELVMRKEKLDEYIKEYTVALKKYGEEVVLNVHVAIEYSNMAWGLYAANHNILMNSYSNYKTYYEHIKNSMKDGLKTFDQFGTIGDLRKDNPLLGIHMFKKGFGGEYIEFIGEFDLVTNKAMYFMFKKFIPIYRKLTKKKLKNQKK